MPLQSWHRPRREPFVVGGVALPAGCAQEFDGLDGQVLIELRAHRRKLRGKGQDSLLRQVGGVRQGRKNVRRRERGVALEDLIGGEPVCQVREDGGNGNSRTTDARLAVENSRIDGDVFAPVHMTIVANVRPVGPDSIRRSLCLISTLVTSTRGAWADGYRTSEWTRRPSTSVQSSAQ